MKKIYDGLYVFDCNLDLLKLKSTCFQVYDLIKHFTNDSNWLENDMQPNAPATLKSNAQYSFLSYPFKESYNLFKTIQNSFFNAEKDYYGYNLKCNYFIKSWLNVYYKGQFIDWHSHHYNVARTWHGFFCVDTEPSITRYKFEDAYQIDVDCLNNTLIIGLGENNKHKTLEWAYDKPRITVAFDIIPEQGLSNVTENNYIPI